MSIDPTINSAGVLAPVAWEKRRIRTTVVLAVLLIAASLLLHWLAQPIVGGLVGAAYGGVLGAAIGINGIAGMTGAGADLWGGILIASTVLTTLAVLADGASRAYIRLSWLPEHPEWYGMSWWRECWRPVLLGTGVHVVIYSVAILIAINGTWQVFAG